MRAGRGRIRRVNNASERRWVELTISLWCGTNTCSSVCAAGRRGVTMFEFVSRSTNYKPVKSSRTISWLYSLSRFMCLLSICACQRYFCNDRMVPCVQTHSENEDLGRCWLRGVRVQTLLLQGARGSTSHSHPSLWTYARTLTDAHTAGKYIQYVCRVSFETGPHTLEQEWPTDTQPDYIEDKEMRSPS